MKTKNYICRAECHAHGANLYLNQRNTSLDAGARENQAVALRETRYHAVAPFPHTVLPSDFSRGKFLRLGGAAS